MSLNRSDGTAGDGVIKPLVEMDLASFSEVFATNVTGAMLRAREAAKHFIERKSGNIINIGSTAAVRGATKGTADHGSKFASGRNCGRTTSA